HPFLYMSGSSPEAGEFAARNRIGIGSGFTTVPLAKAAAQHYRVCARDADWEIAAEDVIYRPMFHVADTDEQAFADTAPEQPRRSEQGHRGRRAAIGLLLGRCCRATAARTS